MKCSKCKKEVKTESFATFRTRKGEIRRRGICKECRGNYAIKNFNKLKKWRENYNKNNRSRKRQRDFDRRVSIKAVVDAIKSETPCNDCHRKFPAVAMDFDHCKGKNRGIASMVSGAYKIDLILEEIKLCELVCACCHRVRTALRKQNHAPTRAQSM